MEREPTFYSAKEDLTEETVVEDNTPTIPFTEYKRNYTKETILKQGLVLCTQSEEWYTRRKSTMREMHLRKSRLRWRRFKAVLKPNRIELYHVTVS